MANLCVGTIKKGRHMKYFELLKTFILKLLINVFAVFVLYVCTKPNWDPPFVVLISLLGVSESVLHTWRYTVTGRYSHRSDEVYGFVLLGIFVSLFIIVFALTPAWQGLAN